MTDTKIDEIGDGLYRLSTFVSDIGPTGFTFNQFLIDDDEPLLFHTGPRAMFGSVSEALATVVPLARLRWITFGHLEADESGAMNEFLAAAPAPRWPTERSGAWSRSMTWPIDPRWPWPTAPSSCSAVTGSSISTPPTFPTAGMPGCSTNSRLAPSCAATS